MVTKLLNKKSVLTMLLALALLLYASVGAEASMISDRNGLEENQDWLYFMYANQEGCFFLQPSYDEENVIFVEDHNACKNVHHGSKFIGNFEDNDLWEFVSVEKYVKKKTKLNSKLNSK